eukprot:7713378-Pyramimonas_sp.AAC.2
MLGPNPLLRLALAPNTGISFESGLAPFPFALTVFLDLLFVGTVLVSGRTAKLHQPSTSGEIHLTHGWVPYTCDESRG